jgi:hypothetical protein
VNRLIALAFPLLLLAACRDASSPSSPIDPLRQAQLVGAPAPSPLVSVPLPNQTLELWPFTGFGFGQAADPVSLIWIGHPDPRVLRAALLLLDGDRTAFGFPDAFPFNCTWHDDPEVQTEVAYTTASGWVGSPIMLECGTYDQARLHLRFFDVGGATVGGAPFEVYIPGSLQHQTLQGPKGGLSRRQVVPQIVPQKGKTPSTRGPKSLSSLEAPVGIEPTNRGFADLCLTTWLRRRET